MKLSFNKQSDGEITVHFRNGADIEQFSYSMMVKKIYDEKKIEDAEILGEFSEIEQESIRSLINELRTAVVESEIPGEEDNELF